MFQIDLAADGKFLLILPGRSLEIPATIGGLEYIKKVLRDHHNNVRNQRGYIGTLPTQHCVDKKFADKFLAEKKLRAKESLTMETKLKAEKLNIDWNKLEIKL